MLEQFFARRRVPLQGPFFEKWSWVMTLPQSQQKDVRQLGKRPVGMSERERRKRSSKHVLGTAHGVASLVFLNRNGAHGAQLHVLHVLSRVVFNAAERHSEHVTCSKMRAPLLLVRESVHVVSRSQLDLFRFVFLAVEPFMPLHVMEGRGGQFLKYHPSVSGLHQYTGGRSSVDELTSSPHRKQSVLRQREHTTFCSFSLSRVSTLSHPVLNTHTHTHHMSEMLWW